MIFQRVAHFVAVIWQKNVVLTALGILLKHNFTAAVGLYTK